MLHDIPEINDTILLLLDVDSMKLLSRTCKGFAMTFQDENFWKRKIRYDFGEDYNSLKILPNKEMYLRLLKIKKKFDAIMKVTYKPNLTTGRRIEYTIRGFFVKVDLLSLFYFLTETDRFLPIVKETILSAYSGFLMNCNISAVLELLIKHNFVDATFLYTLFDGVCRRGVVEILRFIINYVDTSRIVPSEFKYYHLSCLEIIYEKYPDVFSSSEARLALEVFTLDSLVLNSTKVAFWKFFHDELGKRLVSANLSMLRETISILREAMDTETINFLESIVL